MCSSDLVLLRDQMLTLWGKQQIEYKGIPIRLTADLSVETLQARREWQDIFKVMKGKNIQKDYSTQQGSHSDSMEKLKPLQISKS